MNIKRKIKKAVVVLASFVCAFSFISCKKDQTEITFYVPDGAALLSSARIFDGSKDLIHEGYTLTPTLVTGESVRAAITAKTPDIALAPVNICFQSYYTANKEYVFAGVTLMGLNHIVSKDDSVTSLSGLIGETLYAFQNAGTPGLTLRAVLSLYEIPYKVLSATDTAVDSQKVNLMYLSGPADVRNALSFGLDGGKIPASDIKFALLSDPVATSVINASGGTVKRAFDLQQLYEEKTGASYPQVGVIIRKSLMENHKEFCDSFISALKQSSLDALTDKETTANITKDIILSNELPDKNTIISFLNGAGQTAVKFTDAGSSKITVERYLNNIIAMAGNNSIIGGDLPSEDFYYL